MRILYSSRTSTIATDPEIIEVLESVSECFLRDVVQTLSFPRHFVAEPRNNRLAAEWITKQLQMWTDTANFRNPNYHRVTDTPDTLDYAFLRRVTQLLLLQILLFSRNV